MSEKILQAAEKARPGNFAPELARFNYDVLFGEAHSREDKLSLHTPVEDAI